ncbi:MAG: SPOR domain-containing protein [Pseudomonadota bacterium]
MTPHLILRVLAATSVLALTACDDAGNFVLTQPTTEDAQVSRAASTTLVERDVEAPEAFQVTTAGLWDGRPSLGGVWIAHPDVKEPERVIIRNEVNDKFVIGALFRREREAPGPQFQVSSDAAAALGMLAGAPSQLNVTALRREQVPEVTPAAAAGPLTAPDGVTTTALDGDDPIAQAAAAIDNAPQPGAIPGADANASGPITPTPVAATAPAAAAASALDKPFVQIGIFSVEANARRTAENLRGAGVIPTVLAQESKGKAFWRVVVGPIQTKSDRDAVLKTVKGQGFSDAYFVTN